VRLASALLSFCICGFCQPPPPRALVRQSIQNGERAWKDSTNYQCLKTEVDEQFDSAGNRKSTDRDLYRILPLGSGVSFEQHVEHNGEPISRDLRDRNIKQLEKLRSESPAELHRRFEKELAERSYMREVPDAFDFRIVREDSLPTGRAWVLEATPRPSYQPKSRYARMFSKMRGTLWIDERDVQWVKADAVASETVSFGLFIARVSKGSHIVLEQMKLPDGEWVPKSLSARANARTFLLFDHNFSENITYSQYRKSGDLAAAARPR